MSEAKEEGLVEAVLNAAAQEGGRMTLSCAKAHGLAAQYGVPPLAVGRICQEREIKIRACQLGCFK